MMGTKGMSGMEYQICSKTIMDTSDPSIQFDAEGVCQYYHCFRDRERKELVTGEAGRRAAHALADRLKVGNRGKDYDCIIGLSGGVDSSYVAYIIVKELGLRPLAIHMDNGWNSELAVANIENIVKRLNIDLHTEVLDWGEFRDLQKAFFRASVGNVEMATDHAINAVLFRLTRKFGIRNIISGSNLNSEGIVQTGDWSHDNKDWTNIRSISRKFGNRSLKSYPHLSAIEFASAILIRKVRFVPILNLLDYNKAEAIGLLERELGWRNYGRKHGESIFTRFFQEYYLPEKFGVDKRRSHLSSLICSGQMSRDAALLELQIPLFESGEKEELLEFVCKKLEFSSDEWAEVLRKPPVPHSSFKTSSLLGAGDHWLYRLGRKIATGRKRM